MRRRFAIAMLVSAAGLAAVPAARQTPDAEALVKQGRTLMTAGKHDEAERLYRQALTANPRSFEGARALGILLNLKGQYPEARNHLQRAIKVAPTPTVRNQATADLALSYVFDGNAAEAQRHYETVRLQQQVDGDFAGAGASARAIGRIYLEAGDVGNGRKWYELGYREWRPLPSQPEAEQLLWELRWRHSQARIAAREGKIDEARRLLSEFESIMQKRGKRPEDNELYRWVAGYVAYYAKDYDRAIAELTQGNLADPFILNMIGLAYEGKGDQANARQYFRRTLESNVHSLQAAIARPQARAKLGS
jgi:tetratricopeptide (TPR) repeat protein